MRMVAQQEWKKEFEKTRCATCICFLKYVFNLEKALRANMEAIGIRKYLAIEIYKRNSFQMLSVAAGIKDENKEDKNYE